MAAVVVANIVAHVKTRVKWRDVLTCINIGNGVKQGSVHVLPPAHFQLMFSSFSINVYMDGLLNSF